QCFHPFKGRLAVCAVVVMMLSIPDVIGHDVTAKRMSHYDERNILPAELVAQLEDFLVNTIMDLAIEIGRFAGFPLVSDRIAEVIDNEMAQPHPIHLGSAELALQ